MSVTFMIFDSVLFSKAQSCLIFLFVGINEMFVAVGSEEICEIGVKNCTVELCV